MTRNIEVTAKVKPHGGKDSEIFNPKVTLVLSGNDNIQQILEMIYGGVYEILDYSHEPAPVYVSFDAAIEVIKKAKPTPPTGA